MLSKEDKATIRYIFGYRDDDFPLYFLTNYNNHKNEIMKNKVMGDGNPKPLNYLTEGNVDLFEFTETSEETFNEQDVKANKQLRVNLDVQLQNLKKCPKSRERSLAITKLQEAIMWLGMDLKRLNEPNPYPNSYDPTNSKIEPTADGMKL